MRGILLVFIFAALSGGAAEQSHFTYGDFHAMGGVPMVGVGWRAQKGIHALDLSGNTCPMRVPHSLSLFHARGLYLLYPARTGFYLGGGVGVLNEPETVHISGTFEGAIGFQWKHPIFLELDATSAWNSLKGNTHTYVWPGVTLGVGF